MFQSLLIHLCFLLNLGLVILSSVSHYSSWLSESPQSSSGERNHRSRPNHVYKTHTDYTCNNKVIQTAIH